jgi:hypothetical protein
MLDLNTADASTGGSGDLIPENTVARAILTLRPGGAGEGGWLKQAKSGALMIDGEWTITSGPHAKRKIWRNMMMTGNDVAVGITMRQLRAAIEGHHGIKPDDMSEAAQAKRRATFEQLNGIEACIMIGIEKQEGYEPRNSIKAVIAPGESKFIAAGQAPAAAPAMASAPSFTAPAPAAAKAPAAANKPAWAQ